MRKLIKYSMGDMLAAAASDQALDFWQTIVDPFFGLPPQQPDATIKVQQSGILTPQSSALQVLDVLS